MCSQSLRWMTWDHWVAGRHWNKTGTFSLPVPLNDSNYKSSFDCHSKSLTPTPPLPLQFTTEMSKLLKKLEPHYSSFELELGLGHSEIQTWSKKLSSKSYDLKLSISLCKLKLELRLKIICSIIMLRLAVWNKALQCHSHVCELGKNFNGVL